LERRNRKAPDRIAINAQRGNFKEARGKGKELNEKKLYRSGVSRGGGSVSRPLQIWVDKTLIVRDLLPEGTPNEGRIGSFGGLDLKRSPNRESSSGRQEEY